MVHRRRSTKAYESFQAFPFISLTFSSCSCFERFRDLDPGAATSVDDNPLGHRHSVDVMFAMPELEFNPFRDRMCAVFSTAENEDASISFEDFLDMASGS